jgi:hypothetical protein
MSVLPDEFVPLQTIIHIYKLNPSIVVHHGIIIDGQIFTGVEHLPCP